MTTDQLTGAGRAPGSLVPQAAVPRAALVAACMLALASAGCAGSGRGGDATGSAPGGAGGLGTAPATTTAPPPGPAPATTQPPQHSGGGSTTTQPPSGPQIIYFRVAQQPKCPQGTTVYPVPGKPLILEWKVSGGDEVALSVDNPGVVGSYGRYPLTGSQELTFSCGGAPGTTEKHTYTLYTVGGGAQRSKTLTVSAVVYEIGSP